MGVKNANKLSHMEWRLTNRVNAEHESLIEFAVQEFCWNERKKSSSDDDFLLLVFVTVKYTEKHFIWDFIIYCLIEAESREWNKVNCSVLVHVVSNLTFSTIVININDVMNHIFVRSI